MEPFHDADLSLCSCRTSRGSITLATVVGFFTYIIALQLLVPMPSIATDPIFALRVSAGLYLGYFSQTTITYIICLCFTGIAIGLCAFSLRNLIEALISFLLLQIVLFFFVGLFLLAESTNYDQFQGSRFLISIGITIVFSTLISGYLSVYHSPKKVASVPVYMKVKDRQNKVKQMFLWK